MSFESDEHQANEQVLKKCDFCGETSRLYEGVCKQCEAIRAENRKRFECDFSEIFEVE